MQTVMITTLPAQWPRRSRPSGEKCTAHPLAHGRLPTGTCVAAAPPPGGQRDQRRGDSRGGGGGRGPGGGRGGGRGQGRGQQSRGGSGPGRGFSQRQPKPPPQKPERPTLVQLEDPSTGRCLECLLRRRIKLSDGRDAGLLTPLDTPINVLRGDETEDMDDLEDVELEEVMDLLEEELITKAGLLLQRTAFCLTVRGAVRYNDEDVLELEDEGDDEPSMAVELLSFSQGADDYLVYAPLDPLVILATPGPEAAAAAARGQTGAQAAPWQALLGLDEEEEPALAEALEVLNRQLQALARDI